MVCQYFSERILSYCYIWVVSRIAKEKYLYTGYKMDNITISGACL